MSTFDERERAFEAMFAHDEEMRFRAEVHRVKAVARWAAERSRQPNPDAYVQEIVERYVGGADADALVARLRHDFVTQGTVVSDAEIITAMDRYRSEAVTHLRQH